MEQLYSIEDARKMLGGISKWTLYAWCSQGKVQRVKIGSRTMIAVSELEKLMRKGAS